MSNLSQRQLPNGLVSVVRKAIRTTEVRNPVQRQLPKRRRFHFESEQNVIKKRHQTALCHAFFCFMHTTYKPRHNLNHAAQERERRFGFKSRHSDKVPRYTFASPLLFGRMKGCQSKPTFSLSRATPICNITPQRVGADTAADCAQWCPAGSYPPLQRSAA